MFFLASSTINSRQNSTTFSCNIQANLYHSIKSFTFLRSKWLEVSIFFAIFITIYFFLCSLFLFNISEARALNFSRNQVMKSVIDIKFMKELYVEGIKTAGPSPKGSGHHKPIHALIHGGIKNSRPSTGMNH